MERFGLFHGRNHDFFESVHFHSATFSPFGHLQDYFRDAYFGSFLDKPFYPVYVFRRTYRYCKVVVPWFVGFGSEDCGGETVFGDGRYQARKDRTTPIDHSDGIAHVFPEYLGTV